MIFQTLVCINLKSSLNWQYSLPVYHRCFHFSSILRVCYFHQYQCFVSFQHEIEIFFPVYLFDPWFISLHYLDYQSKSLLITSSQNRSLLLMITPFSVIWVVVAFWCYNMLLHVNIISKLIVSLFIFITSVLHCIIIFSSHF